MLTMTPGPGDVTLSAVQASQQCSSLLRAAESASHDYVLSQQQLEGLRQAVNPYSAEHTRLTQLYADGLTASQALQASVLGFASRF